MGRAISAVTWGLWTLVGATIVATGLFGIDWIGQHLAKVVEPGVFWLSVVVTAVLAAATGVFFRLMRVRFWAFDVEAGTIAHVRGPRFGTPGASEVDLKELKELVVTRAGFGRMSSIDFVFEDGSREPMIRTRFGGQFVEPVARALTEFFDAGDVEIDVCDEE